MRPDGGWPARRIVRRPTRAETRNAHRIRCIAVRPRCPNPCGSSPISKAQPAAAIRTLAELGQRDFGENYLQEALPKLRRARGPAADLALHRPAPGQQDARDRRALSTGSTPLDRERIAVAAQRTAAAARAASQYMHPGAARRRARQGRSRSKTELAPLARRVLELPRLQLRGLMCIPPPRETFEAQRQLFARARGLLRANCAGKASPLDTLSMGMSGDLEAAVAAGATCVRIGTAIFGERSAADPSLTVTSS